MPEDDFEDSDELKEEDKSNSNTNTISNINTISNNAKSFEDTKSNEGNILNDDTPGNKEKYHSKPHSKESEDYLSYPSSVSSKVSSVKTPLKAFQSPHDSKRRSIISVGSLQEYNMRKSESKFMVITVYSLDT